MKSVFLSLALVVAQAGASAAPPSTDSVERLLDLMNAGATVEQSYAQAEKFMRSMAQQAIGQRPPTEAETRALDVTVAKALTLLKSELSWQQLKPDYVRLYVDTFTQDELDALIAFYGSPGGQAFIRKMPVVIQGSMEISQSKMKQLMPQLMQIVRESAQR